MVRDLVKVLEDKLKVHLKIIDRDALKMAEPVV